MRVLVTGANGFVGSHLCPHLLEQGHSVTSVVRQPGSAPIGTREVVCSDIGPSTDWSNALDGQDVVVHLAARVHVMKDTSEDPLAEFRRINSLGTNTLARAAAKAGVGRFVYLSTIKVNGEGTDGTAFTAADTPRPEDPYGMSKLEAETALRTTQRELGLDVIVVRSPLVYGPGVGGNFIRLLALAAREIPVPLSGVTNRRTMVSIWNLIDLLEKSASDPDAKGSLILAGDGCSPSTPEMLREISAAMGRKSRLFPLPVRVLRALGAITGKSSIVERLVDSLEVEAGSNSTDWEWRPVMSFSDSIRRTATWYLAQENSGKGNP